MAKALTVVLLIVLLAGGGIALWSVENAHGKKAEAEKLAALEREIAALKAKLEGPRAAEIDFAEASDRLPFLFPFVSRIEKLEERVSSVEGKLLGNTASSELFGARDRNKADTPAPLEPVGSSRDESTEGPSPLEELAQQDREHIKSAIREVIEEWKVEQKLANYENERDDYRRKIVDQLRKAAGQLELTDFQRQALQGLVDDMFAQMDRAAEDARFENKPEMIKETRERLEKELSTRAIELLDAEQLKKLEQLRKDRDEQKKNGGNK
ncbi:MAG: hypothetical protein ACYS8W_03835 [Planctomycetota bacterium]|jgi:hypothetical protein